MRTSTCFTCGGKFPYTEIEPGTESQMCSACWEAEYGSPEAIEKMAAGQADLNEFLARPKTPKTPIVSMSGSWENSPWNSQRSR